MKPTPTPEMIEAAAEAIYNLFTYDEPGEKPEWVERGNSFKQEDARRYAAAALSVPAAAVVGETERDALRRRIYADLAKEGGGTWATYVCTDIFALEDAAFEAGKEAAPSAPDGWQPIETAPKDAELLAYGSYLYPGDKAVTEYTMIAEVSFGDAEFPYRTSEGTHRKGFFSHWRPLPAPPALGGAK